MAGETILTESECHRDKEGWPDMDTIDTIAIVLEGVIVVAGACVAVLFGSGLGRLAWEAPRLSRRHRAVKRWPIGEAPEGEIGRLRGRVRALDESLTSPVSGRRCVYYAVVIQGTMECVTQCKSVPFVVEDPSGRAIIEPANGTVALTFDRRETLLSNSPRPPALLGQSGVEHRGLFGTGPLRLLEGVVEIGQHVEVVGVGIREANRELSAEAGYRGAPPTSLHVTNSSQAPLTISTAVHDD